MLRLSEMSETELEHILGNVSENKMADRCMEIVSQSRPFIQLFCSKWKLKLKWETTDATKGTVCETRWKAANAMYVRYAIRSGRSTLLI